MLNGLASFIRPGTVLVLNFDERCEQHEEKAWTEFVAAHAVAFRWVVPGRGEEQLASRALVIL